MTRTEALQLVDRKIEAGLAETRARAIEAGASPAEVAALARRFTDLAEERREALVLEMEAFFGVDPEQPGEIELVRPARH